MTESESERNARDRIKTLTFSRSLGFAGGEYQLVTHESAALALDRCVLADPPVGGPGEIAEVARLFPGGDRLPRRLRPGRGARPRTMLADAVHLSDREIARLAESGTRVAHCPVEPVPRLRRDAAGAYRGRGVSGPGLRRGRRARLSIFGAMRVGSYRRTRGECPSRRGPPCSRAARLAPLGLGRRPGPGDRRLHRFAHGQGGRPRGRPVRARSPGHRRRADPTHRPAESVDVPSHRPWSARPGSAAAASRARAPSEHDDRASAGSRPSLSARRQTRWETGNAVPRSGAPSSRRTGWPWRSATRMT